MVGIPLRAKRPVDLVKYERARTIFDFPARDALLWVLNCLYVKKRGKTPEDHLASIAKKHSKDFYRDDIDRIKAIGKHGLAELEKFDGPFLCKIIKLTCNLDGIGKNDFEKKNRSEIKKIIKKMKNNRNLYFHDIDEVINLSASELDEQIYAFIEDIDSLILISGELSGKSDNEIIEAYERIENDIISLWQYGNECTGNDSGKEIQEEMMESDILYSNTLSTTFQGKDQSTLSVASGSNETLDYKYANKSEVTYVETEDDMNEMLEMFLQK